jgi:hypothetical protein
MCILLYKINQTEQLIVFIYCVCYHMYLIYMLLGIKRLPTILATSVLPVKILKIQIRTVEIRYNSMLKTYYFLCCHY